MGNMRSGLLEIRVCFYKATLYLSNVIFHEVSGDVHPFSDIHVTLRISL